MGTTVKPIYIYDFKNDGEGNFVHLRLKTKGSYTVTCMGKCVKEGLIVFKFQNTVFN